MKSALRLVPGKAQPAETSRAAIIDEFGELDRRVQEFKPTIERHEKLKSQIKSWYDEHPAEEPAIAEGQRYTVQVSAREMERKIIDMPRLFKLFGVKRFLELCSIPLSAVDKHIDAAKHGTILSQGRTGSRRLKPVAKASMPEAA